MHDEESQAEKTASSEGAGARQERPFVILPASEATNSVAVDLLLRLPGINSKNVNLVVSKVRPAKPSKQSFPNRGPKRLCGMRVPVYPQVKNLRELACLDEAALVALLGKWGSLEAAKVQSPRRCKTCRQSVGL